MKIKNSDSYIYFDFNFYTRSLKPWHLFSLIFFLLFVNTCLFAALQAFIISKKSWDAETFRTF